LYSAFGNTSGAFNLGRTATHEIGHYLNLFHTFQGGCAGTTAATCGTSGDRVCDTPPVASSNGGCPSGTLNSCTETPTNQNDQWMNYMDYTDDACMYMFSNGQKERVDACLYGARSALLSSDALIPVASGATADLWVQDKPDDVGSEPNVTSDLMYVSEDIWVRNAAGTTDQQHQNPVSNTTNHVYVRVRNRVCGSNGTATVRLFWAKASPSLSWPSPWDGSLAGPPAMGGEIGTASVTVSGSTASIVHFTWNTPNVDDYIAMGANAGHFCLLARIETGPAPNYGLTNPSGTGDLWNYVKNNNNIAWKNIEVVSSAGGGREKAIIVGNMERSKLKDVRIVFTALPDDHKVSFFDVGKIRVTLGEKIYGLWQNAGKKAEGLISTNNQFSYDIQKSGSYIGGLAIEPNQLSSLKLNFEFTKHVPWGTHKAFRVTVEQWGTDINGNEKRIGGQDFTIRNPKTNEDDFKGGESSTTGPGEPGGFTLTWWMIALIALIFILIIWVMFRKRK
jgi:hypothetical protein